MASQEQINTAEGKEIFTSYDEVCDSFELMGLQENLLRGIYAYGFEKPSAIQQKGIFPFIKGFDVIQEAPSGTGKKATLCVGILNQLDYDLAENCQAVVLAPTRELAEKIEKVMLSLGCYLGVRGHSCVGGTRVVESQQILSRGVHVVVGTPGRVLEMLRRRYLYPDYVKMYVLYDTDEMMSRGFLGEIYDIFNLLPPKIQVGVFSSTILPPEKLELTRKLMCNPRRILIERDEFAFEDIKIFHVMVEKEEWKFKTLCDLYGSCDINQCAIFVNTGRKVNSLAKKMRNLDLTVSAVARETNMYPNARDVLSIREFSEGFSSVLITTDLLARGIDPQQVSLVINYDLPTQPENYLHCIRQSGGFGRKGVAIIFVTREEDIMFFELQKFYNCVIEELPANLVDLI
ncbi:OLC1v1004650C1 [Oldenlandia corymbosa var. corymbosa]|uniref:ATP-dependent RNA helicase n=1 Tax=Oldenlandia corymbosa var. corymbosa TaxID=529605 RepID=A0AAV1DG98_OLDCO|nr:OLC1v1004650C1 [Oldenlandia corymbosa var. corymbosa]